ncbi:hypothetical protein SO694_0000202 [Aureococcus anophagefferens]|uniref:Uncharacterized protein n=1 Tax=Aureococcus anophagefferens TaxID=44056 RepID=A0ABR1GC97_AURAN
MAAAMFDSRPIEIARPLLFESEEDAQRAPARRARKRRRARASGARRGAAEAPAASPPTAPPVEAPAEAPAPAAAPAKKKKKRSRAQPPEISEYGAQRARVIAAGNKKLARSASSTRRRRPSREPRTSTLPPPLSTYPTAWTLQRFPSRPAPDAVASAPSPSSPVP